MAIPSITESMGTLYTSTWEARVEGVKDNIFNDTPYYYLMRKQGGVDTIPGGRWIGVPLMYKKNPTDDWIVKGGTVSISDFEFLTMAKFDWAFLAINVIRFWVDEFENQGKHQIVKIVTAKLDNAENTLVDTLETAAFTAKAGNAILGLPDLVATSAATLAGIARGTETWWDNQRQSGSGRGFSFYGVEDMGTLWRNCSKNRAKQKPTALVTGVEPYAMYEAEVMPMKQIVNKDLADASFEYLEFHKVPLIWASAGPSDAIYFLNMNDIKLAIGAGADFRMTQWKPIPNQTDDQAAQILVAIQQYITNSRNLGVYHTISA